MSETGTPILALEAVGRRFERSIDMAERLLALFGRRPDRRTVHAVDSADLAVAEGEVVGLVGESGCGKSTLARIAAGILPPSAGTVRFRGRDVAGLGQTERLAYTLQVQMIFQDPFASLNPRQTVGTIIGEAPRVHGLATGPAVAERVARVMHEVGLDPSLAGRFPHQLSGGQRQRVGIARALSVDPRFLVCDEAVSALDVSVRAQVLNLFLDLRRDRGLTYLFISHDLSVVRHIADRVAIMYLGRIVERGPAAALFATPTHPYTQALLAEIPRLSRRRRRFTPVAGEIPSPLRPPPGCHFHPRCPHALARCRDETPALRPVAPGRWSACHLNDQA